MGSEMCIRDRAGAVDRLRGEPEPRLVVLAATDPANPFGAAIPWPKLHEVRFARAAGCYVALWNGELAAFLNHRRLTVRDIGGLSSQMLAEGLAKLGSRHRRFRIDRINDLPAAEHPLAAVLQAEGFAISLKGLGLPASARRY